MARGPTERGVRVPVFRDCQLHSEPGQRLRQAQLPRGDARPFLVCPILLSQNQFSTKASLFNQILKLFVSYYLQTQLKKKKKTQVAV